MNIMLKTAIRNQGGAALVLTLVLLMIGGLIMAPLFGHIGTGHIAGEVHERRMDELYAADAGVEQALWTIDVELYAKGDDFFPYHYPEEEDPLWIVNGKRVEVVIDREDLDPTCLTDHLYHITSTATTIADGSATTVQADLKLLVFDLFAGALVSSGDITFQKDCTVVGDVYYTGEIKGEDYTLIDGEEIKIDSGVFPGEEQIEALAQPFKEEALLGGTYTDNGGNMEINGDAILGPIYIPGNLDITKEATITLNGAVYVKGTITAEKDLSIIGSGSIIAEGSILLKKLAAYTVEGDSVLMSLYGDITLFKGGDSDELYIEAFVYAPNGTITFDKDMTVVGSVVGASIDVKKDGAFTYIAKASSFGFFTPVPYGSEMQYYSIEQN